MKRLLLSTLIFSLAFTAGKAQLQPVSDSSGDYYPILSQDDLHTLRDHHLGNNWSGKVFRLMNDITLDIQDMEGWSPIGDNNEDYAFYGFFDGNGYTISGLWIDTDGRQNNGLFGYIESEAYIKDLNIVVDERGIKGRSMTGALVGQNKGTVINCSSTGGEITGYENCANIGGLIGWTNGMVTDCHATNPVKGLGTSEYIGGLIGWIDNDTEVSRVYATGNVTVEDNGGRSTYIGGLVGYLMSGSITDAYSTGNVTVRGNQNDYIGGLVGANEGPISNAYAIGEVNTEGTIEEYIGSFSGCQRQLAAEIHSSFYLLKELPGSVAHKDIQSGNQPTTFLKGLTDEELKTTDTYKGSFDGFSDWEEASVWVFEDNEYPRLKIVTKEEATGFSGGKGTRQDPYLIRTAAQLDLVRHYLDCHFQVDADAEEGLDLSSYLMGKSKGWEPIGTTANPFTGYFSGYGVSIKGLWIDRPEENNVGLFGVNEGTLNHVRATVYAKGIKGKSNIGGLVGLNKGTVINSGVERDAMNEATVGHANATYVGGLIGRSYGSVINCQAAVRVTGAEEVGGAIGFISSDENEILVFNTISSGVVTGTLFQKNIGAFIGRIYAPSAFTLTDCYYNAKDNSALMAIKAINGISGNIDEVNEIPEKGDSYYYFANLLSKHAYEYNYASTTPTILASGWDRETKGPRLTMWPPIYIENEEILYNGYESAGGWSFTNGGWDIISYWATFNLNQKDEWGNFKIRMNEQTFNKAADGKYEYVAVKNFGLGLKISMIPDPATQIYVNPENIEDQELVITDTNTLTADEEETGFNGTISGLFGSLAIADNVSGTFTFDEVTISGQTTLDGENTINLSGENRLGELTIAGDITLAGEGTLVAEDDEPVSVAVTSSATLHDQTGSIRSVVFTDDEDKTFTILSTQMSGTPSTGGRLILTVNVPDDITYTYQWQYLTIENGWQDYIPTKASIELPVNKPNTYRAKIIITERITLYSEPITVKSDPGPEPDPVTYYKLIIELPTTGISLLEPSTTGISIEENGQLTIRWEVDATWQDAEMTVTINNVAITPKNLGEGKYSVSLSAINSDQTVRITLERKEDPTAGTQAVAETATRIYCTDGKLYIETATPQTVSIYTLNGMLKAQQTVNSSIQISLPAGIYIVKAGEEVCKVTVY